jgi:hypothetical protein
MQVNKGKFKDRGNFGNKEPGDSQRFMVGG